MAETVINSLETPKKTLLTKRRRVSLPQWATAWLVLIPALIFLVFFMFYPILNTFFMSFIQDFRWVKGAGSFAFGNFIRSIINPSKTAPAMSFGFGNFVTVLTDPVFPKTIWNTAELVLIQVPLTIIISLLLATFLNSIKALKGLYQTIFFLPYVTNTIALGLVFNMLFSYGQGGLINLLITKVFGGQKINWLLFETGDGGAPATRFHQGVAIVTYAVWNGLAFKVLVFMSGLATIDKQYYDAARIDGAKSFTIWRRITLPLLSPQILYITITSFIGSFKMYTGVMSLYSNQGKGAYYFGGEFGEDWMPIVGWIYKQLKDADAKPGVAAAGSLILLAIILFITLIQFGVSKKKVTY